MTYFLKILLISEFGDEVQHQSVLQSKSVQLVECLEGLCIYAGNAKME